MAPPHGTAIHPKTTHPTKPPPHKMNAPSKTTGACTRKKFLKWFNAHYKEIQADCRAETRAILAELEADEAAPAAAPKPATPTPPPSPKATKP